MLAERHARDELGVDELIDHAIGSRQIHPLAARRNAPMNLFRTVVAVLRMLQIIEHGSLRGRTCEAGAPQRVEGMYRGWGTWRHAQPFCIDRKVPASSL
ncbi:hypothetical protein SAMN05192539_103939 [Paraburkholderia diazotrophica]|uniref:Uncharacterized protein n=1 Tax=Paraburkholderia diazotrophica TaxID=667676 RepID=A0A1H7E7V0_9BURK|nr:hypothetical protein SAMN05192539_103939 [Paraburkholderia diazotrophica]